MPLIVKTHYHRSGRHRKAGLLEINLLPPTRAQRVLRWCKDIPKRLGFFLAMLGKVVGMFFHRAYIGARPIFRVLLGVRRRVSTNEAIEIATREVEGEGRECKIELEELFSSYIIRVETIAPPQDRYNCIAMRMRIDMRDGRILASQEIRCIHNGLIFRYFVD